MCAFVQDVIHNEDMKLDWEFKLSLLTDLVMVFWCLTSEYCNNSKFKFSVESIHASVVTALCIAMCW